MCGIVGYVGGRKAAPIIIDLLKRLEYRGYDSAGICLGGANFSFEVIKNAGSIAKLIPLIPEDKASTMGIGHTRWATHGVPSTINAHPHSSGGISVVHNGIVENYMHLKKELEGEGYVFVSDTDTEVIPHLIRRHMANAKDPADQTDLMDTVRTVVGRLNGSYALAVMEDGGDRIIATRLNSPLVIGIGDGENFIASDTAALLPYTRDVVVMQDGEFARVGETVEFFDANGNPVDKIPETIDWNIDAAEKAGYDHFMLKEIYEQVQAVENTIAGRLDELESRIELDLPFSDDEIRAFTRIQIIACGTSYNAGLLGKYLLEELAGIHTDVEIASEFRYTKPVMCGSMATIAITQSGETADTLAAVRGVGSYGCKTLAIVNVVGSSITHETDGAIYTRAGPEIGVAATKTFTTQIVALMMFALHCAKVRRKMTAEEINDVIVGLKKLPSYIQRTIKGVTDTSITGAGAGAESGSGKEGRGAIVECAAQFSGAKDYFFLGRNMHYPIALEGALKLKEISYIHAEGYAAGELKHGPLALISEGVPVVALISSGPTYEKMLSNIKEVKARGATVIGIADEGDEEILNYADVVLRIPKTHYLISPVLLGVVCQLLAYYTAYDLNCEIDKPKNLAKSVTVE